MYKMSRETDRVEHKSYRSRLSPGHPTGAIGSVIKSLVCKALRTKQKYFKVSYKFLFVVLNPRLTKNVPFHKRLIPQLILITITLLNEIYSCRDSLNLRIP